MGRLQSRSPKTSTRAGGTRPRPTGALTREGSYSEDSDTGRPRVESPIDDVPVKRVPTGATFQYEINATAMISGDEVTFRLAWTHDDAITDSNLDDNPDLIAFLAWLESIRVAGVAVGTFTDGVTESLGGLRDYRLEQGGSLDDVDVQISDSFLFTLNSVHRQLDLTFEKVSGETGSFNIEAIRGLIDSTIAVPVDEDTPIEEPERGATDIALIGSKLVFADGRELYPKRDRLILKHPTLGEIPVDGDSVRSVKFADLDTQVGSIKKMPNDGAHVVHFGHNETAAGTIRFRNLEDQVQNDGVDEPYRIHNVSNDYDVTIQDMDAGTLIILRPGEQCSFQVGLERDGSGGEINAIDPPLRYLIYSRGLAMPSLDDGQSYLSDSHDYRTLRWPSSAVNRIDDEAFTNGTGADPPGLSVNSVIAANWGIQGSFQIDRPGWVDIDAALPAPD